MPERRPMPVGVTCTRKLNNQNETASAEERPKGPISRKRSRIEKQFFLIRLIIDRFDRDGWLSPLHVTPARSRSPRKYEAASRRNYWHQSSRTSQNGLKTTPCKPPKGATKELIYRPQDLDTFPIKDIVKNG